MAVAALKLEFPEIPHGDNPTGEKLTRVMDRSTTEPQFLAGGWKISDFVVYTVVNDFVNGTCPKTMGPPIFVYMTNGKYRSCRIKWSGRLLKLIDP